MSKTSAAAEALSSGSAAKDTSLALVLLNGEAPPISLFCEVYQQASIFICADGALSSAMSLGRGPRFLPDLVIGDLDSVSKSDLHSLSPRVCLLQDTDQNTTDAEKAIRHVRKIGYKRAVLLGVDGGRTDHFLYHLKLLYTCADMRLELYCQQDRVYRVHSSVSWQAKPGLRLSFFAFSPVIVSTFGLEYNLSQAELSFEGLSSISNRIADDQAGLQIHPSHTGSSSGGALLIFEDLPQSPSITASTRVQATEGER